MLRIAPSGQGRHGSISQIERSAEPNGMPQASLTFCDRGTR